MTAPMDPRQMRFGGSGSTSNERLFKYCCATLFAIVGYNFMTRGSEAQELPDFDQAEAFDHQGSFGASGYDSQAPMELQSRQYTAPYEFREQEPQLRGGVTTGGGDGLSVFPAAPPAAMEQEQYQHQQQPSSHHKYYDHDQDASEDDVYAALAGSVNMKVHVNDDVEEIVSLDYYHCGPTYTLGAMEDGEEAKIIQELILLHGAKFTKEDWKTSGILEQLCDHKADAEEDASSHVYFSVVALDLPVESDGLQLAHAFEALANGGVISGMPATFVTPSASGKSMVDLADLSRSANEDVSDEVAINLLQSMVQAWIPFAPPAVKEAEGATLNEFANGKIPVLAMYGLHDAMGKEVSDKLEALAGAKVMVLGDNHPGYLDNPEKFVSTVKLFIKNLGTWFMDEA